MSDPQPDPQPPDNDTVMSEPQYEDPFDTGDTDYAQAQEALVEYNRLLDDSANSLSGMDRLMAMDGPEIDYIGSLEAEGGEEGEVDAEETTEPEPDTDLFTDDSTPTASETGII